MIIDNVQATNLRLRDFFRKRRIDSTSPELENLILTSSAMFDMLPLVYDWADSSNSWQHLSVDFKNKLELHTKKNQAIELLQNLKTNAALKAFDEIPHIIFKGGALAFQYYKDSSHRPRIDTDILIRPQDLEVVRALLRTLGYSQGESTGGSTVSHQIPFINKDKNGFIHCLDIHWKVSNVHAISDIFNFDDLMKNSVSLSPSLRNTRAPDSIDSIMIACTHRVAHHLNSENLIWLYDIHLLCQHKPEVWFNALFERAAERKILSICKEGLRLAQYWFGTSCPKSNINDCDLTSQEFSAKYLRPGRKWIHDIVWDLQYLKSWRKRFKYLYERAFPSSDFMFSKYNLRSKFLLPLAYALRILTGVSKIFSRLKP